MKEDKIYHERQSRELCALHTLNNLFQDKHAFTKKDLDDICVSLSPDSYINPHRSVLNLGNYDVNVIMAALQKKNYDTVWFDKRRSVADLCLSRVVGFILNLPSDFRLGPLRLPLQRKHWIAIRQIRGIYYNLDSKLSAPAEIGTEAAVREFLTEQLAASDRELLLMVEQGAGGAIWEVQT